MALEALGQHVALKKVEAKQEGAIIRIREDHKNEAEVISVGADVALPIEEGDIVIYNGGKAASVDGEDYILVKEEDLLAVKRDEGLPISVDD